MERLSKLLQLLYFIPAQTAPVPPRAGPRDLSQTLTKSGVHGRGGQETPPKRLTTSLSHLICDIGRTTKTFSGTRNAMPGGKNEDIRSVLRNCIPRTASRDLDDATVNTGVEMVQSDGNGLHTIHIALSKCNRHASSCESPAVTLCVALSGQSPTR